MQSDDIAKAQYDLLRRVVGLASGVSLAIRDARRLNLPVEPGVKQGGQALVRWHALLVDLLPGRADL